MIGTKTVLGFVHIETKHIAYFRCLSTRSRHRVGVLEICRGYMIMTKIIVALWFGGGGSQ